jgi:GDPmannose 4,6-dehydratase
VTRKITRGLARIAKGLDECLYLGNLNAKRDWGHAKDYVKMQWLMLQQEKAEDYVIASGEQHSVRQFVMWSAENLGITLRFEGEGLNEVGVVERIEGGHGKRLQAGQVIVRVDSRYYRPAEVETLLGNPQKAKENLGWIPETDVRAMCAEMIEAELIELQTLTK